MKRSICLVAFLHIVFCSFSQSHWTTSPLEITSGNAIIGVSNKRSLNFVTNDSTRMVIDSLGVITIKRLAGNSDRLLFVDGTGRIKIKDPDGYESIGPCIPGAFTWFEGGNSNPNDNSIGTCSYTDFVLKTDNTNRVWLKADGKLGVGTSSPSGDFEVQNNINPEIIVSNTSTGNAALWAINSAGSYGLAIDNNGIGHISNNRGSSQHNLIGFGYNSANTLPEQVWIGTRPISGPHSDYNFAVGGKALCKSLYVSVAGTWADYVFDKNYKLKPLKDVESYISENGHLPDVPAAKEIVNNEYGLNIAEMQKIQMQKIEELFLYTIKLQKELEILKLQNEELLKSKK